MILTFATAANAWGHRGRVTYRPISDWAINNPRVLYWYSTPWDLFPEGYIIDFQISDDDQYSGFITEKELDNGRAEIRVRIFGNVPIGLYNLGDWLPWRMGIGPFPENLISEGNMYIIDDEIFTISGPGEEIPGIFDLDYPEGFVSGYALGFGSVTFSEYAENFGFTSGERGTIFLYTNWYVTPEGEEFWPNEIIEIYT
jgi:hypothetical protein